MCFIYERNLPILHQIGTSFCLTITTIVFQRIAAKEAPHSNGPSMDSQSAAQLSGYHAAQWTTFGFSMLGKSNLRYRGAFVS